MRVIIVILMFFVLGCLLIVSNNNLSLSNSESFERFTELGIEWIDKIFSNLKSITGEAVNMDWTP